MKKRYRKFCSEFNQETVDLDEVTRSPIEILGSNLCTGASAWGYLITLES